MNPYSVPPLMSAVLVLLLGLYVICLDGVGKVKKIFFGFSLTIFIWLVSFSIMYSVSNPADALFCARFAYVGLSFGGVTALHFHFELLNKKNKYIKLLYLLGAAFAVSAWTPYFFNGVKLFFWGYYPQASYILYPAFIAFSLTTLWAGPLYCLYEICRKNHDNGVSDFQRRQLRFTLIGFVICNFAIVDYLAKFGIPVYPFGYFNVLIWCAILTFTIARYYLMDEEKVSQAFQREKLTAIGTLAASVQHEIKNPLYIIQGLSESHLANLDEGGYASQEKALERSTEILRKSVEHSRRAMEIMKNFTQFAKESVSEKPKLEPVPLSELLDGLMPLVNAEFAMNRINFIRNFSKDDTVFHSDRRHAEEIFFNLIVNSCQAMKAVSKKGELRIGAEQQEGSVHILVEDNGPGISSGKLKQVFEPFYTTKEDGTGLGLYITKQLVERNGGKISVKSKPGEGTSFRLEFKR